MERRVRWIILGFCCALFAIAGPLLVLFSMGYRFKGGQLHETGLILMESTPAGATVWIDGKPAPYKTPASIYKSAPNHYDITIKLAGYHDWKKTFSLEPQTVIRTEHIVLLPSDIEPARESSRPISCFALSSEGRFLVYADTQSPPHFWIKNLGYEEDEAPIAPLDDISLPKGSLVKKIEIGPGGHAALVSVVLPGEQEAGTWWLSLRGPYSLIKIDAVPAATLFHINPHVPQQVIALSNGKLCRIDIQEKTVTWDADKNIETFEAVEDTLWFLKELEAAVFAKPLNSVDTDEVKTVFTWAPSPPNTMPGRRLAVDGQRNVVVLLPSGNALVRGSADADQLTIQMAGNSVSFSPDHQRSALVSGDQIHVTASYPLNGMLPEPPHVTPEPIDNVYNSPKKDKGRIVQSFWFADSAHLLVRKENLWRFVEVLAEGGRNDYELFSLKSPDSNAAFDARDAALYFTDRRENDPESKEDFFLYSVRLQKRPAGWFDWFSKKKSSPAEPSSSKP